MTTYEEDWLDACPPDFALAETHGSAVLVKKMDARTETGDELNFNEDEIDKQSGLPIRNEHNKFPICCDKNDLKELGSGFPLYYHFK